MTIVRILIPITIFVVCSPAVLFYLYHSSSYEPIWTNACIAYVALKLHTTHMSHKIWSLARKMDKYSSPSK